MHTLSSVPVLQDKRERRHEASTGADGKEARNHGSEEGGATKSARGAGEGTRSTAVRGTTTEVLGSLVRQERAVLVKVWRWKNNDGSLGATGSKRTCSFVKSVAFEMLKAMYKTCMKRCTTVRNRTRTIAFQCQSVQGPRRTRVGNANSQMRCAMLGRYGELREKARRKTLGLPARSR